MDYDLWLRLGKISHPIQLNIPLVVFRRHEGSLSTSQPLAALQEDFKIRLSLSDMPFTDKLIHSVRYFVRKSKIEKQLRTKL
jgi:hypothetical protein